MPRDPDGLPAGRLQGAIAGAVVLEGGSSAVRGAAVQLGDHALGAPEAVAFEPLAADVEPCVGLGSREVGGSQERSKPRLELAASDVGTGLEPFQDRSDSRSAGPAGVAGQQLRQ